MIGILQVISTLYTWTHIAMFYIFKKEYMLLVYVTNGAYQKYNNVHVKVWLNSCYCLILYQSVVYLVECFHSFTYY